MIALTAEEAEGRQLIDAQRAAAALGVSYSRLCERFRAGQLPAVRMGRRWLVCWPDLWRELDDTPVPPPPRLGILRGRVGTVYLIAQRAASGAAKIGFTQGPPVQRLADLQTGSSSVLYVASTFRGSLADEHALHAHFAHLCLAGEWFSDTKELRRGFAAAAQERA